MKSALVATKSGEIMALGELALLQWKHDNLKTSLHKRLDAAKVS